MEMERTASPVRGPWVSQYRPNSWTRTASGARCSLDGQKQLSSIKAWPTATAFSEKPVHPPDPSACGSLLSVGVKSTVDKRAQTCTHRRSST